MDVDYVIENQAKTWIPTSNEDLFTNQLIDAYLHGRKDGIELIEKLKQEKLNENINKSGNISKRLIRVLKDSSFSPIDAYLRVHSFDRFDIMVTVPEEDYLKDEFLDMYGIISDIEAKSNDDFYKAFISICSTNNHFEEQIVASDGYTLKLAK